MLIALRFVEQQKEKPMPHTKKYGSGFSCKDFSKQNKNLTKGANLLRNGEGTSGQTYHGSTTQNKTTKTRHLRRCDRQTQQHKTKAENKKAVAPSSSRADPP